MGFDSFQVQVYYFSLLFTVLTFILLQLNRLPLLAGDTTWLCLICCCQACHQTCSCRYRIFSLLPPVNTFLDNDPTTTTGQNSKIWKAWKSRNNAAAKVLVKALDDDQLIYIRGLETEPDKCRRG